MIDMKSVSIDLSDSSQLTDKQWAYMEFKDIDTGDKRLDKRFPDIMTQLSLSPSSTIPKSMNGWKETMATYRLFNNDKVHQDVILAPHRSCSLERASFCRRLLLVQDTTELDFTSKPHLQGTGALAHPGRLGFLLHTQYMISDEGLPLGVWDTSIFSRDGKAPDRKKRPFEEKESYRWLEGYESACNLAGLLPSTQVISVSDREGDIYEVLLKWQQERSAEILTRCYQNRQLENGGNLLDELRDRPVLGEISFTVSQKVQMKKKKGSRHKTERTERKVTQQIRAGEFELKGKRGLPNVKIWGVMATEQNPPKGEDPIEWVMLTSLPAGEGSHAAEIIKLYLLRWQIEEFHRILKSGCKVEGLQLKKEKGIRTAIVMLMVVAWRIAWITKVGRIMPDAECDIVFGEAEWKATQIIMKGPGAEKEKPTIREMIRMVGALGGHLGRKCDGEPGPMAIWEGMKIVRIFAIAWLMIMKWLSNEECFREALVKISKERIGNWQNETGDYEVLGMPPLNGFII